MLLVTRSGKAGSRISDRSSEGWEKCGKAGDLAFGTHGGKVGDWPMKNIGENMVIHGDLPQEKNTLETQRNMVIYPTETRRVGI